MFYDTGVTGSASSDWIRSGSPTVITDEEGTIISSNAYSTSFANKKGTSTDAFDWVAPFVVEVDIVDYVEWGDIQIYDNSHNCNRTFTHLGITGNNHLKIVVGGDTVKYYVDGVEKPSLQYNYSIGTCRVSIRTDSTRGGTIKYKNFMIYPIG